MSALSRCGRHRRLPIACDGLSAQECRGRVAAGIRPLLTLLPRFATLLARAAPGYNSLRRHERRRLLCCRPVTRTVSAEARDRAGYLPQAFGSVPAFVGPAAGIVSDLDHSFDPVCDRPWITVRGDDRCGSLPRRIWAGGAGAELCIRVGCTHPNGYWTLRHGGE